MQPASDALQPATAAEQPSRYGEVFDRGYRHYDGPRLGRNHALAQDVAAFFWLKKRI